MALAYDDFEQIRKRILMAYDVEDPVIQKFRSYAVRIKNDIKPIRSFSVNAVSFVSADGGDNRLYFNPGVIELVRVVDSRGNQCALDAIAGNARSEHLDCRGEKGNPNSVQPLQKLCSDLGVKVNELSPLLKGLGERGRSTGAVRAYRDILEWAVLYDLLFKEWGSDTILIREGLLRSKSFKKNIFPVIDKNIRAICRKHKANNVNVSIIGVAKRSAVLSRLAIALELEETFHKPFPCYSRVPEDIEWECYKYDRSWLDTLETSEPNEDGKYEYESMGRLFLVKFGDRPFDPVWPVDIAVWDENDAPRLIGQLLNDAQPGFPIPDFPMSVQRAHEFARVNGIEQTMLQDMLFEGMVRNLSASEREKILRMKYLGEDLIMRRYKNA